MKTGTLRIRPGSSLEAEISVPGDKSISHRAAILAALSNGPCAITNFLEGEDCLNTCRILESMGVRIERPEPGVLIVHGCAGRLNAPPAELDCGNSGTTMRLMAGILAAQPFGSRLSGDASLAKRPMRRVIDPLRQMGAAIVGMGERGFPPLMIKGGPLRAISYQTPVASAQVKSAILLAGLFADGITTVTEPAISRDHTERMLKYFLVDVRRSEIRTPGGIKPSGCKVTIPGRQVVESRDFEVPGDLSSAAFWLVAAAVRPGSRLLVKKVGLNPTRTGILDVLVRMGARVREVVEVMDRAEPSGLVDIRGSRLRGVTIGGGDIANVIDELPVIAVAAALAEGTTVIRDAAELRVKESDRIAAVASNLRAMGVGVEETPDGMVITGREHLEAATLPSYGDHRIAMAFAIAGLHAKGTTTITDTACVNTSYPGFERTLRIFEKGGRTVRRTARYIRTPEARAKAQAKA
jgi:3-phosphoshikimate 1-carboxyvinyltransferase